MAADACSTAPGAWGGRSVPRGAVAGGRRGVTRRAPASAWRPLLGVGVVLVLAAGVAACARHEPGCRVGAPWSVPPGTGRRAEPMGVAPSGDGGTWVCDARGARLVRLSGRDGSPVDSIGAGVLRRPVDVASAGDSALVVADFDLDRVVVLGIDGAARRTWGGAGTEPGRFRSPSGVDVDPASGRVAVADFANHRVQVFDARGGLVRVLGREGHGDGELYYPTDVTFDGGGGLVVADAYNHRLVRFDGAGRFGGVVPVNVPGEDGLRVPVSVAVEVRTGRLFVADSAHRRIVVLARDGRLRTVWRVDGPAGSTGASSRSGRYTPTHLAWLADGRLAAADPAGSRVVRIECAP